MPEYEFALIIGSHDNSVKLAGNLSYERNVSQLGRNLYVTIFSHPWFGNPDSMTSLEENIIVSCIYVRKRKGVSPFSWGGGREKG